MKPQAQPARLLAAADDPIKALVQHLAALHALLRELEQIAVAKLAAMRKADAQALQDCASRESHLLEQVLRLARLRPAVLARAAQSLPGAAPAAPTLSQIANRAPQPISSALRARMRGLEEVTLRLQESNRVAALVARELHARVRDLFAALANGQRGKCGYGPQGRETLSGANALFEAVG